MSRQARAWGALLPQVRPLPLALLAAALSIAIQGFEFGINNNIFHIPLVLGFDALPQFADDPVIGSLRRFVSPVYVLLAPFADESNVEVLFFLLHAATRALTFTALLLIAAAAGASGGRLLAAAAVLSVSRGIYGSTFAGGGGMLMKYFTHSELSTAFALLLVAALLRGRLILAGALGGITFAVNAFIGVWMVAPLGLAALGKLAGSPTGGLARGNLPSRLRAVALAGLAYALPALPVAVWALGITRGEVVDFDYRGFLRLYYGQHFFLDASTPWSILQCVAAAASAVLALPLVSRRRRVAVVLTGLLLVLSAGMVVGALSTSFFVLNLHLLRVDALITMLAAVLVVTGGIRQLTAADPPRTLLALVALAGVVAALWVVVAIALGLLAWLARREVRPDGGRLLRGAFRFVAGRPRAVTAAAVVLFVAYASAGAALARRQPVAAGLPPGNAQLEGFRPASPEWLEVQLWARANTPENARFLVPLWPAGFRVGARRDAWADWKEGATAMWAPRTYAVWRRRVDEVLRLRDLESQMAYACANALAYVVSDLRGTSGAAVSAGPADFSNRFFAVRRVSGCGSGR